MSEQDELNQRLLVADAERYRYLRAHACLDGSGKDRLQWYLPIDVRNKPVRERLDADIDRGIALDKRTRP